MDISTLILTIVTFGLLIFTFFRDKSLVLDGFKIAGTTVWNNLLLLLAGFLLAGLVQVLVPQALIIQWLGNEAGFKSVLIGCVAGGLMPGSPYAVLPVVGGLYKSGASLGAVVGFITAWSLWSVSRLPVEFALVDPKVSMVRYGITFLFPPLAGWVAYLLNDAIR